jgi:ABC-type nitrate/sulfonate/bicarbonate transport system permease component
MQKLINTIASSAAVVTLMAGLWQDWNLLTTLKRMFIAYLGSFFLGCLMALAVKLVPAYEKKPEATETASTKKKTRETAPAR